LNFESPGPWDAPCNIVRFGAAVLRKRFLKIYQNFTVFAPLWDPKGASPFI